MPEHAKGARAGHRRLQKRHDLERVGGAPRGDEVDEDEAVAIHPDSDEAINEEGSVVVAVEGESARAEGFGEDVLFGFLIVGGDAAGDEEAIRVREQLAEPLQRDVPVHAVYSEEEHGDDQPKVHREGVICHRKLQMSHHIGVHRPRRLGRA